MYTALPLNTNLGIFAVLGSSVLSFFASFRAFRGTGSSVLWLFRIFSRLSRLNFFKFGYFRGTWKQCTLLFTPFAVEFLKSKTAEIPPKSLDLSRKMV
jgi:hypothetical protein